MEELVPIIVSNRKHMNMDNWCYVHKRHCKRGPSEPSASDELNIGIMGSPCVVPEMRYVSHVMWCVCFVIWGVGFVFSDTY